MAELQEERHGSPKRKLLGKDHVDKPEDYWRKVYWMDETKIEPIGANENNFQKKNRLPSVKHGGGSIMAWACSAASWPGRPAIIDGTMNSELYQQILKENVRTSV